MGSKSAIQWTHMTWNPLTGCTRVTPGCDHCYAFTLHNIRHKTYKEHNGLWPETGKLMPRQYALPFSEIQLFPERLEQPLRIKQPHLVFVDSMGDLFHHKVPLDYVLACFEVMRKAHWHTFQILTKRGNRLQKVASLIDWPPNVWMGVSIENDRLTARADQLRRVPAAVRFLSCEPLLEPLPSLNLDGIDWVIVGGESGEGARPMREAWVCDLQDRCVAQNIPFFFKQWGGRFPTSGGRALQGRTWDEMPFKTRKAPTPLHASTREVLA
jgi:protein gp37